MLFGVLFGAAFTSEAAPSSNVAYRRIDVQDPVTGELFPAALWYPTRVARAPLFLTGALSGCRLPAMLCRVIAFEMQVAANAPPADGKFGVIVISHGAAGLEDASLGSHIQRERIGVVGHSNGGYTALAVAGAKPTPAAIVAHCQQHPDDSRFCSQGGAATREAARKAGDLPDVCDPRVRAIVVMAPNTAPFTNEALAQVAVPVRVYGAERDDLTRVRYHAERLAKALPSQTEYVLAQRAGHFSFVARFPGILRLVAGEAARDPEGFDRDAMHEAMNREIVGFFDRKLPSGSRSVL